MPALYSLAKQKLLPPAFAIIAFARRDKDDATYREDVRAAIREFAPSLQPEGPEWEAFAQNIFYLRSTLDDSEGYHRLANLLDTLDQERQLGGNRLFYLATLLRTFWRSSIISDERA